MAEKTIKLDTTDDLDQRLVGFQKMVRKTKVSFYIKIALKNLQYLNAAGEMAKNCLESIKSGLIF